MADDKKTVFIAIGPYCWGKAPTQEAAVANCKREAPRKLSVYYTGPFRCMVFSVTDPGAYVDDMGAIVRDADAEVRKVAYVGKWTKDQLAAAGPLHSEQQEESK